MKLFKATNEGGIRVFKFLSEVELEVDVLVYVGVFDP